MKAKSETAELRRLYEALLDPADETSRADKLRDALISAATALGSVAGDIDRKLEGVAAEILVDKADREHVAGVHITICDERGRPDGVIVASVKPDLSRAISQALATLVDGDPLNSCEVQ